MKVKDNKNTDEKFAAEAIEAFPVAKEMLIESTGIHAVLALSLADIYGSEAKRLKAKNGVADPRVAEVKLRKSLATESAKEIVSGLLSRGSTVSRPAAEQRKRSDDVAPKPAPSTEKDPTTSAAPASKSASSVKVSAKNPAASKTSVRKKAQPKARSKPAPSRAKSTAKKAPARKAAPKLRQKRRT